MVLLWLAIVSYLLCCYRISAVSCPGNDHSIISLDVSANIIIERNIRILSISSYVVVDNDDNFNQSSGLLSSCIDLLDIGGRFCGLNFGVPHRFELPNDFTKDTAYIESSLCTNDGSQCICSARTTVSMKYDHFTVLSPQPNQTIVTDSLLLLIQANNHSFVLGSTGLLCIETIYRSNMYGDSDEASGSVEFSYCYSNFPEDEFKSTNNSLIKTLTIASGHWELVVTSKSDGIDGSVLQREVVPFRILRPGECYAATNSDERIIQLTDSTYYFDGEDDMMLIRLTEHEHYIRRLILIEANETHNGTARNFALANGRIGYANLVGFLKGRSELYRDSSNHVYVDSMVNHHFITLKDGNITNNDMAKESQQRDALLAVLRETHDKMDAAEYVLVSDTDEVVSNVDLRRIRQCKLLLSDYSDSAGGELPHMIIHLMHHYLYNFNYKRSENWGISGAEGAYTVAANILLQNVSELTPTKLRRLFRPENRATLIELAKRANIAVWKDSGWHMSAFKSPSDYSMLRQYYPGERNTEFFTVAHTTLLQELGLAASDLQSPVETLVEQVMNHLPVVPTSLPNLVRYDHRYFRHFAPQRVPLTEDEVRSKIVTLQKAYKQTLPDSEKSMDILYFHSDRIAENFLKYNIGCVLSADSTRRGDRDEIDRVVCCADCEPAKMAKKTIQCDSIYEYADHLCQLSSNTRIDMTVIVDLTEV